LPQPASILSDHPLVEDDEELEENRALDLYAGFGYDSILADIREHLPEIVNPEEEARMDHEEYLRNIRECVDVSEEVRWLETYFDSHLNYPRSGFPGPHDEGRLADLTPLKRRDVNWYPRPELYLIDSAGPDCTEWRLWSVLQDVSSQVPHSICFFFHYVVADDQRLTTGKVRGIIRWIYLLYGSKRLTRYAIFPILAISYMGPKHVRIIQAHYDGEKMFL
jgi:hypothetical protein